MIPDGETTSLAKNPIFIFNIPVIPLGSLQTRDALPCPVKFVPEIRGKCTWPSANILEYRLETQLDAATKYQATISLGSEFLYPLETPFEATFSTIPLQKMVFHSYFQLQSHSIHSSNLCRCLLLVSNKIRFSRVYPILRFSLSE